MVATIVVPMRRRRLTGTTGAVLVVIVLCLVAELVAYTGDDFDFLVSLAEPDPDLLFDIYVFVGGLVFFTVPAALLAVVTLMTDSGKRRRRPGPAGVESARRPWLAVAALGATSGVWLAWIGWDGHKDVDAFGNETGPWEVWQIFGFIVCLAAVAAVAARWLPTVAIVVVMSVTITVLFSMLFVFVEIPDHPYDAFNGLWVMVVALIFLGMLAGTSLIAALGRVSQDRRLSQ